MDNFIEYIISLQKVVLGKFNYSTARRPTMLIKRVHSWIFLYAGTINRIRTSDTALSMYFHCVCSTRTLKGYSLFRLICTGRRPLPFCDTECQIAKLRNLKLSIKNIEIIHSLPTKQYDGSSPHNNKTGKEVNIGITLADTPV